MVGRIRSQFTDKDIKKAVEGTPNYTEAAKELSKLGDVDVTRAHVQYWAKSIDREFTGPRILFIDIETSPILAYTWGLFKQNIPIDAIVEDWYIISWSAKWLGDDKMISEYCYGREDEATIVESLRDLLSEADIVVAHNAKKFDIKKINAKFFEYRIMQPTYYKVVDTLQIAKGNFAMTSNKLDYITKLQGFDGKLKTDLKLWIDCMDGDYDALQKMVKYCEQDVRELEHIYLELRAWDSSHPSYMAYTDSEETVCNVCGSSDLIPTTQYHTGTSTFQVYQCKCGHQQRDRVNMASNSKQRQVNVR